MGEEKPGRQEGRRGHESDTLKPTPEEHARNRRMAYGHLELAELTHYWYATKAVAPAEKRWPDLRPRPAR